MEDKKKEKTAQEEIRKQLEDMLLNADPISDKDAKASPIANDDDQNPLNKAQHPGTKSMDFYKVKEEIETESRKLLKSVIDFYLDVKVIKKNEYIKYKKSVDEMTLSNITFSLRTTQHAIIKLLEEIDMGNIHPRVFEVLAQLQTQMVTVAKMQASYMITIEEGYKKIKEDNDRIEYQRSLDKDKPEENKEIRISEEPLKVRGTKNLMIEMKKRVEDINFEEVEKVEAKPRLTDPHNRPANPMATEAGDSEESEEENFGIDEDLF